MAETWEQFRERIFGTPYMIWHDGPDGSQLAYLQGEEKEHAFQMLSKGLAIGDYVAIGGLGALDPQRALPLIKKAWNSPALFKLTWISLAEFLRQHDPEADNTQLANVIIGTLKQNNIFSIEAILALKHYPTPDVVDALLTLVARHHDYLIRYHAANALLHIAQVSPTEISEHDDIFHLIRGPQEGEPTNDDLARYAKAADSLRQKLAMRFAEHLK